METKDLYADLVVTANALKAVTTGIFGHLYKRIS